MKKTFFFALAALCAGAAFGGETADLQLGDVTWAAANVDAIGTFAPRPDMYTQFYQWNRSTAWNATDESVSGWRGGWNSITDPAWTINPCPAGWRLPTQKEFKALVVAGSVWANADDKGNLVSGRFYGPNNFSCSLPDNMTGCIFLPAVGSRNISTGALIQQGTRGYYWSGTQYDSNNGYLLYFPSTGSQPGSYNGKAYGFSVRCVK